MILQIDQNSHTFRKLRTCRKDVQKETVLFDVAFNFLGQLILTKLQEFGISLTPWIFNFDSDLND